MLLNEFMEGVSSDNKLFELDMMKIVAYTERAEREYEINLKQADLKVMTESGTCDDLEYLYEAAGESLGNKFEKALEKIKESAFKFFKGIKEKIASLLGSKKTQSGIDNLENKLHNSKTANMKIKIFDIDKRKKVHQRTKAKLKKELVLAKNGKSSKERVAAILKEHKKALAAIPLTTVTVLAGIKLFKTRGKKSVGEISARETEIKSIFDLLRRGKNKLTSKVVASNSTAELDCARGFTEVAKEEAKDESVLLTNVMNAIRTALIPFTKYATKDGRRMAKQARQAKKGSINVNYDNFPRPSAIDTPFTLKQESVDGFSIFDEYDDMYAESSFDSDDDIFDESAYNDEDDMYAESADDFDTLYENFAREENDNIEDAINNLF